MIQNTSYHSCTDKLWDVIIIGAGPAGSAAAITLSNSNFNILLIDKHRFPREKVCGDGLIGDSQKVLQKFELLDKVISKGHKVGKLSVFSPSRYEILLDVPTITIQRKDLDFIVAEKAVELGAQFSEAKISGLNEKHDHVEVIDSKRYILKARFAVVATGADISLLKDNRNKKDIRLSTIALRTYYKSEYEMDRLIVTYDKSIMPGYGWVFPMENGVFNIGCGIFGESKNRDKINLKKLLQRFMNEFPVAREVACTGERIANIKGARLRCGLKPESGLSGNRILYIGETISTTFNYTGEGIGKAMESGILAGELLKRSLEENVNLHINYPEILKQKFSNLFDGYKTSQKWLSNKFVTDIMIMRTQRSNYLKSTITNVLNNDENPARVFSLTGLLKSFYC